MIGLIIEIVKFAVTMMILIPLVLILFPLGMA